MSKDEESEFNVTEFLKRAFSVDRIKHCSNFDLSVEDMITLCDLVTALFKQESKLPEISPPCTVVGDIHGQYPDLMRLLYMRTHHKDFETKRGEFPWSTQKWVFLGDYVDRGPQSIECICTVFALKVVYRKQYTLLRGNHETRSINFSYGFRDDFRNRFDKKDEKMANEVWSKFNQAFSWMPLACLIGTRILCMHGGISESLRTLDDIRNIQRPIINISNVKLAEDLLWADPIDSTIGEKATKPKFVFNRLRGLSVSFNEPAVLNLCDRLGLKLIIRAHQMNMEGFKFFANNKLLTIFSAPQYMHQMDNIGVVVRVPKDGKIFMSVMKKNVPLRKPFQAEGVTRGNSSETSDLKSASLPVVIGSSSGSTSAPKSTEKQPEAVKENNLSEKTSRKKQIANMSPTSGNPSEQNIHKAKSAEEQLVKRKSTEKEKEKEKHVVEPSSEKPSPDKKVAENPELKSQETSSADKKSLNGKKSSENQIVGKKSSEKQNEKNQKSLEK